MNTITTPNEILLDAFNRKQTKLKSFSIRKLATISKLSPAYLSQIFSGKKLPSLKAIYALKSGLELDHEDMEKLVRSTLYYSVKDKDLQDLIKSLYDGKGAQSNLFAFKKAEHEQYNVLPHWEEIAILDLTTCDNFVSDERWIAKKLNLSLGQVRTSIDSLIEKNLLKKGTNGWEKTDVMIRFPTSKSDPRVREFHEQMIQKAKDHLTTKFTDKDFAQRLITGATIACNPAQITIAKEKIAILLREIIDILTVSPCSEVYQLNLQMFPLTSADEVIDSNNHSDND